MKKIHKLVLKAYVGPLLAIFFIVQFVLMMNFVWRYIDELVGKGLDAGIIIELISYATINMIPMGMPLAMLFAAIMTLGNLGENYELLAMKSAGMSLMQILKNLNNNGTTIILITHDADIASHAKRVIKIHDGKIIEDRDKFGETEKVTREEV